MKCPKCNGTGKTGVYTHHTCYKCSGSGKKNTRKKTKKRG